MSTTILGRKVGGIGYSLLGTFNPSLAYMRTDTLTPRTGLT